MATTEPIPRTNTHRQGQGRQGQSVAHRASPWRTVSSTGEGPWVHEGTHRAQEQCLPGSQCPRAAPLGRRLGLVRVSWSR